MDANSIMRSPAASARKTPGRRDAIQPVAGTELSPLRAVSPADPGGAAHDHQPSHDSSSPATPLVEVAPDALTQSSDGDPREQARLRQQAYSRRPRLPEQPPHADIET